MKHKIAFKTLGCRLNQYETDALVTDFVNAGYTIVDYGEKADAVVVNTCTVTNLSDKRSRQELSKSLKIGDDTVVVATGCMATQYKGTKVLDNITYVVDNESKSDIFSLIDGHFKGEIVNPNLLNKSNFNYNPVEHGFHTRNLIKIQDGCNNFCTFCIVPFVRGRAVSRPVNEILDNIQKVLEYGFKELVLTGVNIGKYEADGLNFEGLIEKILQIEGDFRVRISSIEPEGFGERLYDLFLHSKMTPHIHACIQSGSDKILKAMRRNYSVNDFRNMVQALRSKVQDFNFTTDMIVGFPGEGEDEFEESCEVIKELGFSHIHTFKYSERTGTKAIKLPDKVHGKVKAQRSEVVRKIADFNKYNYRKSFVGKQQRVLVEKVDNNGIASGYGQHYIPIQFTGNHEIITNEFYDVIIKTVNDDKEKTVLGELLK